MDKLKVSDVGGHPIELDDLDFLQDGIAEGFSGSWKSFSGLHGAGNFVFWGLAQTDTATKAIAEGYVALQGEVCYFPAVSGIAIQAETTTDKYYIDLNQTFDPAGNEVFESGGTFDTYEVRRAKVTFGDITALTPGTFIELNEPQLPAILGEAVKPQFGEWTKVDLSASTDVIQNTQSDGTGTDVALAVAPIAGSYYKYIQVGNQVTLVFNIKGIQTTTFAVQQCASIILKNLPFTSVDVAQVLYFAECTNQTNAITGSHPVFTINTVNKLIFNLNAFAEASRGFFNRGYEFSPGSPSMLIAATAATGSTFTWNLTGQIIFEVA